MTTRNLSLATGVLALFVSLILNVRFTRDNARGENSLAWPTTSGRVTQSRIEVREHRTQPTDYVDFIEYEYSVNGRMYRGRTVDLRIRNVHDRAAMQAFVSSYPVGRQVPVHYDPQNPNDALLVVGPANETSGPRLLLARILLPVGMGLIAFGWWTGRVRRG